MVRWLTKFTWLNFNEEFFVYFMIMKYDDAMIWNYAIHCGMKRKNLGTIKFFTFKRIFVKPSF